MYRLLFLSFLFITHIAEGQKIIQFPDLSAVVDTFDMNYIFSGNSYLQLAKCPKGWVTYELDYTNFPKVEKKNEQVFWSSETGKFQTLNYKTNGGEKSDALEKVVKNNVPYNYERKYFHGYSNADIDAIQALEGRKNLGDTLLEGLARAYSNYAMDFVKANRYYRYENASGYISDSVRVSESQADSFIKYVDKGIATFKKLYEQNPLYETLVGNIYIKYCNEHMYAYTELMMMGFEQKAKKYLAPGLYGEAFLSWAKNYFHSVDENAILFTNGDNDTYPLIYLQQVQGFRRDVNVLNYSLLSMPWFIRLSQQGYSGIAPVKMMLDYKEYYDGILDYFSIKQDNGGQPDEKVITSIEQLMIWFEFAIFEAGNAPKEITVGKNGIAFRINLAACKALGLIVDSARQEINIDLKNNIFKNDIAMLDIVFSNNWRRAVFFSPSLSGNPLFEYSQVTGMAQIMTPSKGNWINQIDSFRLSYNILNRFSFIPAKDFKGHWGRGFRINADFIRLPYAQLAVFYNTTGDKINALKTTYKCLELIPASYVPYGENMVQIAEILAQNGEGEEADIVLENICYAVYDEYTQSSLVKFDYRNFDRKKMLNINFNSIKSLANRYELKKTLKAIEKIEKKMKK